GLERIHHGYAKCGSVPIAGEDIACRFAGSALAVCDIHAKEPHLEPSRRQLHCSYSQLRSNKASNEPTPHRCTNYLTPLGGKMRDQLCQPHGRFTLNSRPIAAIERSVESGQSSKAHAHED